jgi:hypothetical protein
MNRTNIHVSDVSILLVTDICREEVHAKRFYVTAPGSCQHCLQSAIALAVTFEREDLLIDMLKKKNKQTNSPNRLDTEDTESTRSPYLALITHKCAQMRGFVPRRCSGVDDNAPRVYRWSKHEGGETRSLILEDDTTIRIFGGIDEPRLRRK